MIYSKKKTYGWHKTIYKKSCGIRKKKVKHDPKRYEKAHEKAQSNEIRKLAIQNWQAKNGAFKALLSDHITLTIDYTFMKKSSNRLILAILLSKRQGFI